MVFEITIPQDEDDKRNNLLEAMNIISSELKKHFLRSEVFKFEVSVLNRTISLSITDSAYVEDIEQAKKTMYQEQTSDPTTKAYMKDFISEVEEYLSFVPEIKVVDNDKEIPWKKM